MWPGWLNDAPLQGLDPDRKDARDDDQPDEDEHHQGRRDELDDPLPRRSVGPLHLLRDRVVRPRVVLVGPGTSKQHSRVSAEGAVRRGEKTELRRSDLKA